MGAGAQPVTPLPKAPATSPVAPPPKAPEALPLGAGLPNPEAQALIDKMGGQAGVIRVLAQWAKDQKEWQEKAGLTFVALLNNQVKLHADIVALQAKVEAHRSELVQHFEQFKTWLAERIKKRV